MTQALNPNFESAQRMQSGALVHFFNLATNHSYGAARVAARLLLGLYNGERFQFDLTDLRLLDREHFGMAMALLQMDHRPSMEVHQRLNLMFGRTDFGMRFEHMAHAWRIKGRCKKEHLDPVPTLAAVQFADAS